MTFLWWEIETKGHSNEDVCVYFEELQLKQYGNGRRAGGNWAVDVQTDWLGKLDDVYGGKWAAYTVTLISSSQH